MRNEQSQSYLPVSHGSVRMSTDCLSLKIHSASERHSAFLRRGLTAPLRMQNVQNGMQNGMQNDAERIQNVQVNRCRIIAE